MAAASPASSPSPARSPISRRCAVPAAIIEAASVLVAGYLRRDRLPAGEISGAGGLDLRPCNPWSDERVKRAVARYRVTPLVV